MKRLLTLTLTLIVSASVMAQSGYTPTAENLASRKEFAESRFGHMCLLDGAKVENAERYFDKHGAVGTFFGRLVPAVRQLISIPAGLARMNIARFFLYTTLGAGIWNCILAAMGWYIGRNYSGQLEEKVAEYSGELKIVMLVLGAAVVLYLAYKGLKK